jgi:hypothetical protein
VTRDIAIIGECIEKFSLDLAGFTVFTEAATGPFIWTPIIAAMAKAEHVYAIAKDSRYGPKEEIVKLVDQAAGLCSCKGSLQVVLDYDSIGAADIVTNSGFVRPLAKDVVERLKPKAVLPLMYETWEFRDQDVDMAACIDHGTLVLGTNEDHLELQTFRYIGLLVAKLLFEAGVELFRCKILIVGGRKFGESISTTLLANGVDARVVCSSDNIFEAFREIWLGDSLGSEQVERFLASADAIVFAEHQAENVLLGKRGDLEVDKLLQINETLKVIHISGLIDEDQLLENGYEVLPRTTAKIPRKMSVTAGYLGPRPVIELNSAGLKVGEIMARARREKPTLDQAKKEALKSCLCQGFSHEQLLKYS